MTVENGLLAGKLLRFEIKTCTRGELSAPVMIVSTELVDGGKRELEPKINVRLYID